MEQVEERFVERDEFINLTKHPVMIRLENGEEIVVEPSGMVARTKPEQMLDHMLIIETGSNPRYVTAEIPVYRWSDRSIKNLPRQQDGRAYIVSTIIAGMLGRSDLYAPNTSPASAIRDHRHTTTIGVKSLSTYGRR